MSALALVGTRKGLFLVRGDDSRASWELEGPFLTGWEVFHAMIDPRDETMYVAANNFVSGHGCDRDGFAVADGGIHADALGTEPHEGPLRQGLFDHGAEDLGLSHESQSISGVSWRCT